MSGDLMLQVSKMFPNAAIGQGYGMYGQFAPKKHIPNKILGLTETATTVSALQPDRKLGTVGSAGELIPGIVAKVVKSDGSLAAEGEQGELVVTGPSMAMGYYENPTAYVNRLPVCCE